MSGTNAFAGQHGPSGSRSEPDAQARGRGPVWSLPGFGPMTRIATQMGDFPAQTLRVGDRVRTRRGPYMPIVWLDRLKLDEDFLACHPEAQPVLIRPGAFGAGLPARDVVVSPGQRLHAPRLHPGARPEPASRLTGGPRILRRPETIFTYTLFHCEDLVDVHVEGLWVPLPPRAPRRTAED